jgi:hypothetical protein
MPFISEDELRDFKINIANQIRQEIGNTLHGEVTNVIRNEMFHNQSYQQQISPDTVFQQLSNSIMKLGNVGVFISNRGVVFIKDFSTSSIALQMLEGMREEYVGMRKKDPTVFDMKTTLNNLNNYPDGRLETELDLTDSQKEMVKEHPHLLEWFKQQKERKLKREQRKKEKLEKEKRG